MHGSGLPFELITGPATVEDGRAVSLAEAKSALKILEENLDADIAAKLGAAQRYVEGFTGPLLLSNWAVYAPGFCGDVFRLPGQINASTPAFTFQYLPDGGALTTVPATAYALDLTMVPHRIVRKRYQSWPSETLATVNPVKITANFGYTDAAAVPWEIKAAITILLQRLWLNREEFKPEVIEPLIASYRITRPGWGWS